MLDAHRPRLPERAHVVEAQPLGPIGEADRRRGQHACVAIGLEAEQRAQQQDRGRRRPRLRARRRRILDRDARAAAGEAGEDLRQPVLELRRGLDRPADQQVQLPDAAGVREPPRDQGVVVRPHRAVVVDERVVALLVRGERAHAPPRPEAVAQQHVDDGVAALRRHDAAPEQMAHVRGDGVDRALVAVEAERVEAVDPERIVEAAPQLRRIPLEPVREQVVAPHLARELGEPQLRVVDVALHLDGRDRRLGQRPVVEHHRAVRVLPRLVPDPA
ncbi:MAG TPA: hypothetical protein VFA05_00010 [Gaiellaceae bacterium]|nr:hypothetical protein [Gaiellaceae bacterium]